MSGGPEQSVGYPLELARVSGISLLTLRFTGCFEVFFSFKSGQAKRVRPEGQSSRGVPVGKLGKLGVDELSQLAHGDAGLPLSFEAGRFVRGSCARASARC